MPQFCRKRRRTEIRARLKGVIFILAVVEQEQNIKSKTKEKNLKACIQISISVESFH